MKKEILQYAKKYRQKYTHHKKEINILFLNHNVFFHKSMVFYLFFYAVFIFEDIFFCYTKTFHKKTIYTLTDVYLSHIQIFIPLVK